MTQTIPLIFILIVSCYLTGSIPSGFLLGKIIRKTDIRQQGSGNVGATNVFRVLGWKLGIIAFLFDMGKGLVAVVAAKRLFPENTYIIIGSGLAVIFGHIFSLYLKFKGGKGVATSAGVFIALTPAASAVALTVFTVVLLTSKYVSAGSVSAALALLVSQFIITHLNSYENREYLLITFIVAALIIIKHRSNIIRLMNGTENRVSLSGKRKCRGENHSPHQ